MELSYDWRKFQSLFYVKRRLSSSDVQLAGAIYAVVDERVIISVFSEGEDLSNWIGATYDEVVAEFPHREIILYDCQKVDEWTGSALGRPHFYDQIQYLRDETKPQHCGRNRFKSHEVWIQRNFLLLAIQSWWQKLFPSTYGVYIHIKEGKPSSLFLAVQRGRINSFQAPDLSGMVKERKNHPADVIKYLSEKYLLPVQGIFISAQEWQEWCEMAHPWPHILAALKTDRSKLVPFKWSIVTLIRLRAYFGF